MRTVMVYKKTIFVMGLENYRVSEHKDITHGPFLQRFLQLQDCCNLEQGKDGLLCCEKFFNKIAL